MPPAPHSESEQACVRARHWYHQAQGVVIRQQDELTTWDPQAAASMEPEEWRQHLMAGTKQLCWARQVAEQAIRSARTRREKYVASLLLSRIECDAGNHARELTHARTLMALAPRNPVSLKILSHAASCNRLFNLAEEADRQLEALSVTQEARTRSPSANEPAARR